MEDIKAIKLNQLTVASLNVVNTTAELHFKAEEMNRSAKRIASTHEIDEEIESLNAYTHSIRSMIERLSAIRTRFNF